MAVHSKKQHRPQKKMYVGTVEEAVSEWFDALKETYAPMPMWGVMAEIEAEDESQESLRKRQRTAELVNHKWDKTKLAVLGFELGSSVKEKPVKGKADKTDESVWKICSIENESVTLQIEEYVGSEKPEDRRVMMDELVACWDKYVVVEDLVYMYGIVIRVRGVMSRLL